MATIAPFALDCFGDADGELTVVVEGGTAPYTYVWTPNVSTTATATGLTAGSYDVVITDANNCTTTATGVVTEPAELMATIAPFALDCFGDADGELTVVVEGGTAPYTYVWTPNVSTTATATGLTAGSYEVVITDANNCTTTATGVVTEPAELMATIAPFALDCFGDADGELTVVVEGGTAPYTYVWTPNVSTTATATGLTAGSYEVEITDANNCTTTATGVVTEPTELMLDATIVDVDCNGAADGSITPIVTGGTTPYTYDWADIDGTDDGANRTDLAGGTYFLTVTDGNGCTISDDFTVEEASDLMATIAPFALDCFGDADGELTVVVEGGTAPYTYVWTPNVSTTATATGLTAGSYDVVITDANNCTTTATGVVTEPAELMATIAPFALDCFGDADGELTVVVEGGTAPYTYVWTPNVSTTATATGLTAGSYDVVITDANNCTTTATGVVTEPTELTLDATIVDVDCNGAADGSITPIVTGGTTPYTYDWADIDGTDDGANRTDLAGGTYFLTVTDGNGCTISDDFTVEEASDLMATIAPFALDCFGDADGELTVVVEGGTAPYTYVWTPNVSTTATATGLTAGSYEVVITDANNCTTTATGVVTEPAELMATIAPFALDCFGDADGELTVVVEGGTAPYTYVWTPNVSTTATATGLTAGSYEVEITDANNCTTTATGVVTEPAELMATIAPFALDCFGDADGELTVVVEGGTAPYTYVWTPNVSTTATATGLTAGSYDVVITDANNCTTTATGVVTEPTELTLDATIVDVDCNGAADGSITPIVTGGTTPYTYDWADIDGTDDGANRTDLAGGTYFLTVTDGNGCTISDDFTVEEASDLMATIAPFALDCFGDADGELTVVVEGGTAPYTYVWTPNVSTTATATGLTAGSYDVEITDANNCTTTATGVVTEPTELTLDATIVDVDCNGAADGSITPIVTGGTTPYTYDWADIDGTDDGATGPTWPAAPTS